MMSQVDHVLAFARDVLGDPTRFCHAQAVLQAIAAERAAICRRWPPTATEGQELVRLICAKQQIEELLAKTTRGEAEP
jgi:hypothetical protein